MNKNYKDISEKILKKRDIYYKKRKKVITSVSLSLVSIFIVFSLIFFPQSQQKGSTGNKGQQDLTVSYVSAQLEITSQSGAMNVCIENSEVVNEIMQFVEDKKSNTSLPNHLNDNEDYFLETTDYLVNAKNTEGEIVTVVVTNNYILWQNGKASYITSKDFDYFKNILKKI